MHGAEVDDRFITDYQVTMIDYGKKPSFTSLVNTLSFSVIFTTIYFPGELPKPQPFASPETNTANTTTHTTTTTTTTTTASYSMHCLIVTIAMDIVRNAIINVRNQGAGRTFN